MNKWASKNINSKSVRRISLKLAWEDFTQRGLYKFFFLKQYLRSTYILAIFLGFELQYNVNSMIYRSLSLHFKLWATNE